MAYITLVLDPSPSGEGYDDEFPTRNNELLAAQLHNTIEDMEDGGWQIDDGVFSAGQWNTLETWVRAQIKVVFDYADSAITQYRSTGSVVLAEPTTNDFSISAYSAYTSAISQFQLKFMAECYKKLYMIYYLWQTEEDPLRIKDYIRDMLIAWPLMDTTIALKDEGGSELRIYPSWSEFG